MRTISDKQGLTLKAATRRSVDMAGGGDALQHVTRVRASYISKCGSAGEDNADKYLPIDVATEADMEAGSPIILSAMAEILGYRVIPIVEGADLSLPIEPPTHKDVTHLNRELMDVVRAYGDAVDDGHVDGREKKEITREIDEAIKALRSALQRIGGAV
ncbi:phage regulatory CII family protein [Ensifer sp. ENS06]|uniref:phage regulatory CII family protein n=1 Tax=Ensifer sp. ENS06 TaxID=2769276 RepID=UPI001FED4105|nr:phage regulatory CII family protein [Ensifer sp. ENS06]